MIQRIVSWFILNILAFYVAVVAVPGLRSSSLVDIALGGLVLALTTGIGGPIARAITFPLRVMTLNTFTLVVDFLLVTAAFWLTTRLGLAVHAASPTALVTGAAIASIAVSLGNVVRRGLLD